MNGETQAQTDAAPRRLKEPTGEWPRWLMPAPAWRWVDWCAVLVGALLVTLLVCWPIPAQLGAGVMTTAARVDNPDLGQNIWNVWHLSAGTSGQNPLWSTTVAAPLSVNLVSQSYGIANLLVVAPIAWLAGPVVAANCIVLLGFWAGIVTMTAAAARMTSSLPLAFAVGCLFALTPAHIKNVEWAADENAAIHWLVMVFLVATWWLRHPDVTRSLGLGVALLIATLSSGYTGLFGVVFVAMLVAAALWERRDWAWGGRVVVAGIVVAGVWGGVMFLLTGDFFDPQRRAGVVWNPPVLEYGSAGLRDWQMRQTIWLHVVSMADLVTPLAEHPLWGLVPFVAQRPYPSEMGGYLGVVVLALISWHGWHRSAVRPLLGVALVCTLLAGGLELKLWYDQGFASIPGPLWLLDTVGVFRNATRPGLFLLYAWIPLALVVADALDALPVRWVQLVVVVCALVDFAPPHWVTAPVATGPAARLVSADGGSVLTLPVKKNDQQPLIDQLCHRLPIVAGYLARTPAYPVTLDPRLVPAARSSTAVLPVDGYTMLQNIDVQTIIASDRATADALVAHGAGQLESVGTTAGASVYRLARGRLPVAMAGAGWWEPEGASPREWRWTTDRAEIVFVSVQPRRVSLQFSASRLTAGSLELALDDATIGTVAVPAQPAAIDRVVWLTIPAGRSVLSLTTATDVDPHGRAVGVAFTMLRVLQAEGLSAPVVAPTVPAQQPWCFSPLPERP